MPFSFTCPYCGHATMVAEQYAGKSGPCVQCGRVVSLPQLDGAAEAAQRSDRAYLLPMLLLGGAALVAAVLVIGVLLALLLPAVQAGRAAARKSACLNNLSAISMALQSYRMQQGKFPPAYTVDENGQPLLSWRVAILPYLGENLIYGQLDQQQPWNTGRNAFFNTQMPLVYRCPADDNPSPGMTSYVAICGPGLLFDGANGTTMTDIADGAENTIMVVEIDRSNINWMEPRDLDLNTADLTLNGRPGNSPSSRHAAVVNVAMADGIVQSLPTTVTTEELQEMLTIAGGETLALP